MPQKGEKGFLAEEAHKVFFPVRDWPFGKTSLFITE